MPPAVIAWLLLAGAESIACWVAARFPALTPRSGRGVAARVLASIAVIAVTPPAFTTVQTVVGRVPAVMVIALPGGVLLVLSAAWLLLWVLRVTDPTSP